MVFVTPNTVTTLALSSGGKLHKTKQTEHNKILHIIF